jgi:uncharacterized membrane protein (DUF373 family)
MDRRIQLRHRRVQCRLCVVGALLRFARQTICRIRRLDFYPALAFGMVLTLIGVGLLGQSSGEGGIKVVIRTVGEITGINGQLLLTLAGVVIVLSVVGYTLKALTESMKYEHGWKIGVKDGLKDTVQRNDPSDQAATARWSSSSSQRSSSSSIRQAR